MKTVQMGSLRPREGERPLKVSQQWPLSLMGMEPRGDCREWRPVREINLKFFVHPHPDSDGLGESTVPAKGLDCYLDSLFNPVLSYGDMVGTGWGTDW